jgi:hypothetical protein
MKNNPVTTVLLGALIVLALLTVYALISFNHSSKEFRGLQQQVVSLQNNQIAIQALAVDLADYSKRNPAITPVLKTFGIEFGATNPPVGATPKPATR